MKRQIRRSVFETNSSSCHSISIKDKGIGTDALKVDRDTNKVYTKFGEFGWGYDEFIDAETKLSYLMTMLVCTHRDCLSIETLYETEDFKKINDAVITHCNCDGIIIDDYVAESSWNKNYNTHNGYIDHQSVCKIDEFLNEYGSECTIEEFLFDRGIKLIISNDNC